MQYRNPGQLANGGVLVVGASATGTQIAEEIHRSGRPVTLAVGEHVRVPRLYRDKDIQWWMDAAGVLDERYDEVDDINRARNVPSLQLAGSPERRTVDLNALTGIGVKLIGRLAGIHGGQAQFSGSLRNQCALADLKMNRLLDTIDAVGGRKRIRPQGQSAAPLRTDPGRSLPAARARSEQGCASEPSSGRPGSGPTTRGSRCRSSTAKAAFATTGGWSRPPACI